MDTLRYDVVDETATITLTNPDLRNALTAEMATELREVLDSVTDSDARCVVVQGSGGTFCAGGDIEAMLDGVSDERDTETLIEEYALPVNRAVQELHECDLPTVAKVDGPAFGAGGALAIACDVVLASNRAKISFGFRQVGLSIDSGTSYLLPSVVGDKIAKELVYTGKLVEAERARELGLFNRVFPVDEFEQDCQQIIDDIATGPTVALSHSKRLLDADSSSVAEAVSQECEALETILETDDHEEGVVAFAEQRSPEFEGR